MNMDAVQIVAALSAGATFGAVYLGVLWVSVRVLPGRHGPLLFVALGLVRAALVIAALAGALALSAPPFAIGTAFLGFVATRFMIARAVDSQTGDRA